MNLRKNRNIADVGPHSTDEPLAPNVARPGVSQLAVPRAAVRQLAACAKSAELAPELLLHDEHASRLFRELGGAFENFGTGELRCSAFRTSVVDQLAGSFFSRHPGGLGVSLWPVLGTRAHRMCSHRWLELDAPAVAALRERYLPARPGWTQLASCLCGAGKVAAGLDGAEPCLFVLDESVLPLCVEVLQRVLDSICAHARPGSELIIAFDERAPLQASRTGGALELPLGDAGELARYPRLRFVDRALYESDLQSSLCGVNAVSRLQSGRAPGLGHLFIR